SASGRKRSAHWEKQRPRFFSRPCATAGHSRSSFPRSRRTTAYRNPRAGIRRSTPVRFAVLVHDLGKAATPQNLWPSHHGHEEAGVGLIEALAARLRVPNEHTELALLAARYHGLVHRASEL